MKVFSGVCLLFAVIVVFSISSCVPDSMPLKGTYDTLTLEITTTKSVDQTWSTITDLFTTQGLGIEAIDKEKGLITSKKTPFIATYTFENQNGQLQVPEALVVLRRAARNEEQKWIPKSIYSKWSVQITAGAKGTVIKIDPVVMCTYYPNTFTSVETHEQSTGKLEAKIRTALLAN